MRKILLVNALVLLLLILVLDVAMFFLLPQNYVWRFPEYRSGSMVPPDIGGRGMYPNGYFVQHEQRGFDIGRNKQGRHWVGGVSYPIWSNSLGCFDINRSEYGQYIYLAGDSFTWGYTPFDDKFGTVLEQKTGMPILKCGVTHTGQQHQLEKLIGIVNEIGKPPEAVFVFYYSNDMGDDFAHPHSTVIDGWQVDDVYLNSNDELKRHSHQEMVNKVQDKLKEIEEQKKSIQQVTNKFKARLKNYSLTTNLLIYFQDRAFSLIRKSKEPDEIGPEGSNTKQPLNKFYDFEQVKNGIYWYSENPKARKNKVALFDFAKYTARVDAEFIVVLIPPKAAATDTMWYKEVRQFLTNNNIRHLDLTLKIKEKGLTSDDLYWRKDGHFNPSGNMFVATLLIEVFPDIFRREEKNTPE